MHYDLAIAIRLTRRLLGFLCGLYGYVDTVLVRQDWLIGAGIYTVDDLLRLFQLYFLPRRETLQSF